MSQPESERLDSWKEIAAYLGRDLRTVRRWEEERRLPVHRVPGSGRRAVFAYRSEVDAWMSGLDEGPDQEGVTPQASAAPDLLTAQPAERALPADATRPLPSGALLSARSGWRSWAIVFLIATVLVIAFLFASSRGGKATPAKAWKPQVLDVRFGGREGNLSLSIDGLGFGQSPTHFPLSGDIPWFRIGDVSCFAVRPGWCEAGFIGDTYTLTYLSWSDNRIVLDDYRVASPGDAVELAIWNPQSNGAQDAVVWGGNIPPLKPGTPQISNVGFNGEGKNLHITLEGLGFGPPPPGVPGIGDTAFLRIGDYAFHSPDVQFSIFFRAGYQNSAFLDTISLVYLSWSETKIEVGGFGGSYGQNGLIVRSGDPISIELWSTRNHLATAWGGRIP